ncbi:MAG TPA: UvrB/UvrC motif-containing protein [Candidatus Omnitrophota bacterium]|nr:UvrB/UvrC motif-containing protein [Candidatus Omnitrophota bacterium]HQJ15369.1 UvrB/UvrC motif-containing protein [Candidatus Omnitrophota bacterium]
MICDICGKNPATVHLTEIIDDQMNELHLCEECAHKKSAQMEQQFGLSDLLAGLAGFEKQKDEKEGIALKCPNCGMTFKDFKKIGRLGCGECYAAFRSFLGPLLKRIHGSNLHCGKAPGSRIAKLTRRKIEPGETRAAPGQDTVAELRIRLQKAVEAEAYEEAARLRDRIKELERTAHQEGKKE